MTITYRSAADVAVDHIRELIHSGQLVAGQKVAIDTLVADMKLSSTPIRDALKRLEGAGLVEIVPRNGVYVRDIPPREVLEVYAIKEALDPLLVFWATQRATDAQVADFFALVDGLADAAKQHDTERYVELVEQRKDMLFVMAGSDVLRACFSALDGRVRWMRHRNLAQPARMRQSIREHRGVGRAVRARDAEQAADLTAEHVRAARRSLAALLGHDAEQTQPPVSLADWRSAQAIFAQPS